MGNFYCRLKGVQGIYKCYYSYIAKILNNFISKCSQSRPKKYKQLSLNIKVQKSQTKFIYSKKYVIAKLFVQWTFPVITIAIFE